jgi:hypothetical protein
VVADQVEISLARDYRRVGELESWWGEAWLSTASHLLPGDELTLVLSGGVVTPIVIERVTVDSKASRMLVRFTGSGPLGEALEETGS